jgi:L-rhamnose mutarotase
MVREAFLLHVRPDKIAEYKEHHRTIWPEMQQALERHGWHNYTLFMRPDGLVFGYVETPEGLETARAGMRTEPVYARWQALMAPLFEPSAALKAGSTSTPLEEVFHLA